nr:uncharacterized protein LOC126055751 [Helicoverpa armigera]
MLIRHLLTFLCVYQLSVGIEIKQYLEFNLNKSNGVCGNTSAWRQGYGNDKISAMVLTPSEKMSCIATDKLSIPTGELVAEIGTQSASINDSLSLLVYKEFGENEELAGRADIIASDRKYYNGFHTLKIDVKENIGYVVLLGSISQASSAIVHSVYIISKDALEHKRNSKDAEPDFTLSPLSYLAAARPSRTLTNTITRESTDPDGSDSTTDSTTVTVPATTESTTVTVPTTTESTTVTVPTTTESTTTESTTVTVPTTTESTTTESTTVTVPTTTESTTTESTTVTVPTTTESTTTESTTVTVPTTTESTTTESTTVTVPTTTESTTTESTTVTVPTTTESTTTESTTVTVPTTTESTTTESTTVTVPTTTESTTTESTTVTVPTTTESTTTESTTDVIMGFAMEVDEDDGDKVVGMVSNSPQEPGFQSQWRTLTMAVSGLTPYDGYVSIMGMAHPDSIVLVDSFRYIPPAPDPTTTSDPTIVPDPTTTPDPTTAPDPTSTPDPTATSDPTTLDPTTTPDPTATDDLASTPDPTTTSEPTTTQDPAATQDPTTLDPTTTPDPVTTENPSIPVVSRGFWNPFTITMVVVLSLIALVIICYIFYEIGRRRAKAAAAAVIIDDLNYEDLPSTYRVPRVRNVIPDVNTNPYSRSSAYIP